MKSQLTQEILFDTLPVLLYAAKNGINPNLRPSIAETHGILLSCPNLRRCVTGCTELILTALDAFGDETPTPEQFSEAISDTMFALISAGVVGEKEVASITPEDVQAILSEPNATNVYNRFTGLLWIRAYPGVPGPDGRVVLYEDLRREAEAILRDEDRVSQLKADLMAGKFEA